MVHFFAHRRRRRARSVVRGIMRIFGQYDAMHEVRSRREAKELLRLFLRSVA